MLIRVTFGIFFQTNLLNTENVSQSFEIQSRIKMQTWNDLGDHHANLSRD